MVQFIGSHAALADTTIRPIPNPLPGTWENISRIKRGLPATVDSIWFDRNTISLIHIQTNKDASTGSPAAIRAAQKEFDGSTSFFGEPKHPVAAQFFANEIYLQPSKYDDMLAPYIDEAMKSGRTVETPYIWDLPEAKGNPHLFYHGQLTPRIVAVVSNGQVNIAETYVPLKKTRNDFLKAGNSEAIVLEVQTKRDAIDAAVVRAGFPEALKAARFRYCVVMFARNGFSHSDRVHIWLATPMKSGIDCNTILAGLGFTKL
jgi:hypothetical protein